MSKACPAAPVRAVLLTGAGANPISLDMGITYIPAIRI